MMKVSESIRKFSNDIASGTVVIVYDGKEAVCIRKILTLGRIEWLGAILFLELKFAELHSEFTRGYGHLPNIIASAVLSVGTRPFLGRDTEIFAINMGWAADSLDTLRKLYDLYTIKEVSENKITIIRNKQ